MRINNVRGLSVFFGVVARSVVLVLMVGSFAGVMMSPPSFCSIPQVISYQGKLNNSSGSPQTGNFDMVFKIYSVDTGGSAIWTESHTSSNQVPVTSGRFSVLLGSITPITNDVFNGGDRWLGITVGGDSEMTPRMRLASMPFAYYAVTAESLSSAASGNYVLKSGDTITGPLTVESHLYVGNESSPAIIGGATQWTHKDFYIQPWSDFTADTFGVQFITSGSPRDTKFNMTSWSGEPLRRWVFRDNGTSTDRLSIIAYTGNVGIGAASPLNKLDVAGNAVIGSTYAGTNTAPTNGLLVEGNVGIGTTSPNAVLDVNGGISIEGASNKITFGDGTTQTTAATTYTLPAGTTTAIGGVSTETNSSDTGAYHVVTADDSRLSNSRTPSNGSIAAAMLQTGAVTSDAILDGTIVDGDIASSGITTAGKVSGAAINAGIIGGSAGMNTTGIVTATAFGGSGSLLTSIPDSALNTISTAGKVSGAAINAGIIGGSAGMNTTGIVTATAFGGSGALISSGTIPNAALAIISTAGKVSGDAINAGTIAGSTFINTTGTVSTSAGVITTKVYPLANSATAFQINAANGSTNVVNVDTTNSRVGIGTTSPNAKLDVNGGISIEGSGNKITFPDNSNQTTAGLPLTGGTMTGVVTLAANGIKFNDGSNQSTVTGVVCSINESYTKASGSLSASGGTQMKAYTLAANNYTNIRVRTCGYITNTTATQTIDAKVYIGIGSSSSQTIEVRVSSATPNNQFQFIPYAIEYATALKAGGTIGSNVLWVIGPVSWECQSLVVEGIY